MDRSVQASLPPMPLKRLEQVVRTEAKADLKNLERWRAQLGRAVARSFSLASVTRKEAAALVDRDEAQIARWVSGVERPQFDALFSVERLRGPLVVALAELAGERTEVVTEIRIRREIA